MSASREGNHKPNDFTPVVGAMDLAEYTLKITGNPNKFPDYTVTEKKNPDGSVTQIIISRDDSLTNIVRAEARRIIDPANVKHERKKLVRMAAMLSRGEITEAKIRQCYQSWTAHAKLGNSYKLIKRMSII